MGLGASFDSVLIAAQEGADWAWEILYREVAPQVLGYLRARGAEDPEDLLGEVFLQLARNLKGFEGGEGGFRSWVFMISHHRLIDERRARQRRPERPVTGALEKASGDDVEAEALGRLSTEWLAGLFGRLTPDQRDVLALRIIAGLTLEETARAVGKRTGAVKALQRRGLAVVRREMEREGVTL
ncbi:MAG: sigma-70 family RNA polymerase sigma factor [Actinomycetota bacterium]|nr:sigma-70 family RNA polymerase sigma factor [Actinomycetota bacterium]